MENPENKKEPSIKRHLIWGMAAGFCFGLLSIAGLYLDAAASPATKFYVWLLTVVPLLPFIALVQPIFELEGEKQIVYILASPVVWAIAGLGIGYGVYRFRRALFSRANLAAVISPKERRWSWLRIFVVVVFASLFVTASISMYRDVINIKKETAEQARLFAEKEDAKRQKKLEEELQKIRTEPEEEKKEVKTNEVSPAEQKKILESLKWKRYSSAQFGIAFDYPAGWTVQKKDFDGEEFDLWVAKPGESGDPFDPDLPRMTILGTKQNFVPDHPNNIAGGCAYEYKNIDGFCGEKCEKLNAATAIDFRFTNQGEPIYTAVGFSSASRAFPRLCLDMSLDSLLAAVALPQDVTVEMVVEKYDLRSPEASAKISPKVFEAIAIFRHMAASLSAAR